MIDLGRKRDMEQLMRVVNDPQQHPLRRRRAYRTVKNIRRKMADKTILRLRLRLIAASVENNVQQVEKISDRIIDYERRHYAKRKY